MGKKSSNFDMNVLDMRSRTDLRDSGMDVLEGIID